MTTPVPAVLVVGDDPYLVSEAVSKALEGIDPLSVEDLSPQEDRARVLHALESTSLFRGRVTPDAVSRQFKGRGQVNMFGFLDAAAGGQTGIALQGLRRLLEQGESAQGILFALARHFRSMMEVGEAPPARAVKELGMHPFRAEKLVKQATGDTPP